MVWRIYFYGCKKGIFQQDEIETLNKLNKEVINY